MFSACKKKYYTARASCKKKPAAAIFDV